MRLREVEGMQGQGVSVADAVRQIGVTVQTYDRWRRLYVGMGREQLRRLKEHQTSQSDGKRPADLTLHV
ncbi:MAG: helix-turn-helix domain-containing protein [Pseudomonadota bacterium]